MAIQAKLSSNSLMHAKSKIVQQKGLSERKLPKVLKGFSCNFPFRNYKEYSLVMRLRAESKYLQEPVKAVERAKKLAADAGAITQIEVEKACFASRFDQKVQQMLGAGLAIGVGLGLVGMGVGAAIGSGFPVIGTVIGAAIGFVIGCVSAIIPWEKWEVLNRWSAFVDSLYPEERYLLFQELRSVLDQQRTNESKKPFDQWRTSDGSFITIYGGQESMGFFMFLKCWVMPWGPQEKQSVNPQKPYLDPLAMYGLGLCASDINDNQGLNESHRFHDVVDNFEFGTSKGAKWLATTLWEHRNVPAGMIREALILGGVPEGKPLHDVNGWPLPDSKKAIPDYGEPPITEEFTVSINKLEKTLEGQQ